MNTSKPNQSAGPTIISGVSASAVNTGTARDVINVTHNQGSEEARQLIALLAELKTATPYLNLAPLAAAAMEKEVKLIEDENVAAKPRKDVLQRSLSCVYGILMGVAGNSAYSGLDALVETVRSLIV